MKERERYCNHISCSERDAALAGRTTVHNAGPNECVVRVAGERDEYGDTPMCRKPVVGEHGGWRMCAEHQEMFQP